MVGGGLDVFKWVSVGGGCDGAGISFNGIDGSGGGVSDRFGDICGLLSCEGDDRGEFFKFIEGVRNEVTEGKVAVC